MNRTNRFFNRTLLLITGIILLFAATGAILVLIWPDAGQWWTETAATTRTWLHETNAATMIPGSTLSWLKVAVLAVLLIGITLLIIALARLGGGSTRTVLRTESASSDQGRITVDAAFVSDVLRHSLDQRDEILFSHVSATEIRDEPVMHVSVTPRQNTSPRQVAEDVELLLNNLATLTGSEIPTYLSIHGGLRARLARDERRLT